MSSSQTTLRQGLREGTAEKRADPSWQHGREWALRDMSASERRGFVLRRLSVLADLASLLVVGALTVGCLQLVGRPVLSADIVLFLAFVPLWPLIAVSMRAYHPHSVGRGLSITISDEFATVFRVSTIWGWFLMVARSLAFAETTQLLPLLLVWALSVPVILGSRSLLRRLVRRRGWYRQRALVVGHVADAGQVTSRIDRHPEWGLSVAREIGVHAEDELWIDEDGDEVESRPGIDAQELLMLADQLDVSRVIFATPPAELDARTDVTRSFIEAGIQVDFVPGEAEILRSGAEIGDLEGLPLMSMPGARQPRSWSVLKRAMDLAIAGPVLLLTSPLIAIAAIRVKRDSPGPAFYRQTRAGRDGRHFEFLKLRTMEDDADELLPELAELSLHGNGLENGIFKATEDPRVTRVGRSLRRRSLDELPQLWNVVKGEMSLVGPRPLPVFEDERVAGHYELRRHVRPGITGPWQVSGRSDIPFTEMLRLDYSYVLNWSVATDLKILVQTVDAVIRGRGAY